MWPDRVSNPGPLALESDALLMRNAAREKEYNQVENKKIQKINVAIAPLYRVYYQ